MSIKLTQFMKDHEGMDEAAFASHYDHPFLIVEKPGQAGEGGQRRAFQTMMAMDPRALIGEGGESESDVHLVKKEGAAQAFMVTVGRTKNNDIVLDNPAVSKLHAYFKKDPVSGTYALTDAGSTNGTVVNGRKLVKNEAMQLKGGEAIEFGGLYKATYHTSSSFYRYLQILKRLGT